MSKNLEGKVALVTGASKGIGAEIARELATRGAKVVVNYASSKSGADRVVDDITKAGGKAVAVQADVAKEADVVRLFEESKKAFGKLDILINNAGIYEFGAIEEITPEHYRKMFDLNVLGLLIATREAVKQFGENGGNIVNIGSVVATAAPAGASVYSATKGAVDTITLALAKELGPRKVRVNSINPGMIETEGAQAQGLTESDMAKQIQAQTPLGRLGIPSDIAKAVAYAVSDDAVWVTGQTIIVSGGYR